MGKSVINYNKLRYFTVAARCLNISRAAAELYIGQPGLSTHIRELEEELGVQLFIRTNRDLILTRAGEVLYNRTAAFFEGEEELIRDVRNAALESESLLHIGTVGTSYIHTLPGLVHHFCEKYPGIEVKISRYNYGPLQTAIKAGDVDMGLQFWSESDEKLNDGEFEMRIVGTGYYLAAMSADHPLAKAQRLSISDLKDCRFGILDREQSPVQYSDFIRLCRAAGFKPKVIEEYRYIEALLTSVNLGNVVALTSSLAPLTGYENIRCIPLDLTEPVYLCLIWRKKNRNPYTELFADFIEV